MTAERRRRTRSRDNAGTPSIEEVARRAEVSVATVSRALRGLPNVATATRERVDRVAAEVGYEVDPIASRLASGKTDAIGLVVPEISTWYFSHAAAGAEAVLADAGRDTLLYSVQSIQRRDRFLAKSRSLRRRLDGFILIDIFVTDREARLLESEHRRVVTLGQRTHSFPSVSVDNRAAAIIATRHLLSLGHRRIALVGNADSKLPFEAPGHRRSGYVEALTTAGINYDPTLDVTGHFTIEGGQAAMAQLLSLPDPPSAVFAMSDEMALGCLKCATDVGLRVPDELSIVGFDNHELSAVFNLTTVHQDPEWQGASAARLLLGLDDSVEPETRHVTSPTRLVVRGTTAQLSLPDRRVR